MANQDGNVEDKPQRRELCSSWAHCDIPKTEGRWGKGKEVTETRPVSEGLNSMGKGCASCDFFMNKGPPTVKAPSLPVGCVHSDNARGYTQHRVESQQLLCT